MRLVRPTIAAYHGFLLTGRHDVERRRESVLIRVTVARMELRHSPALFRLEDVAMRSLILSLAICSLAGFTHPDGRGAFAPDLNVSTAAATGRTLTVNMLFDGKGMRFEPKSITINRGDVIKFVNVSGGPHKVAFDPSKIPTAGRG